jgi:hypothetical protein
MAVLVPGVELGRGAPRAHSQECAVRWGSTAYEAARVGSPGDRVAAPLVQLVRLVVGAARTYPRPLSALRWPCVGKMRRVTAGVTHLMSAEHGGKANGARAGIAPARLGCGGRCLALLSASGPFVEQLRALMDASGFAYQHSRLRLRQAPARHEPRNRAVLLIALAVAHPNRATEIIPLFSGNCAR